ncbi:hypothetical protein [Geodermatophilus dictyosporus]|uniref:hypothetical protein n=1 Tax=Geodermatophilus dictyosporus TaxID=1523247 RepID=UPI00145C2AB5|nr:hypothetical protein [Geodermatophilus dictyosporus]
MDETRRVWSPSGAPVLPPPPGGWPVPPPRAAATTIRPTTPPPRDAPPAAPGPVSGPLPVPGPPARRGAGRGVLVTALVAALAVGGGVATWYALGDGSGGTAEAGRTTAAAATDAGKDLGDAGSPAPAAPTAPTVPPEEQALADLQALRDESLARVVLDGRWVAQVASKDVGITDPLQTAANGTNQFFAVDILAESRAALSTVDDPSDLYVLWSTDFGRASTAPDGDPYWVTLVDGGFPSEGAVDAWCAGAYPQLSPEQLANTCVGRTLTPPHD